MNIDKRKSYRIKHNGPVRKSFSYMINFYYIYIHVTSINKSVTFMNK